MSEAKRKTGRPSAYQPAYARAARAMCLLGATDVQLAEAFGVTERTINAWKHEHPEFLQALKQGKAEADERVAQALFHRAIGYSHKAVKIITVSDGMQAGAHVEQVPYTEHYAPDTTAAIFWLKNRRPDLWRDKQELVHSADQSFADALRAARERARKR